MAKQNNSIKIMQVIVFLLLYYTYMNVIRKVAIPMDGITIPAILMFTFISVVRNRKKTCHKIPEIKSIVTIWTLIAIYIFINNANLLDQLIHGGIIHLYVMISFMIFVSNDSSWLNLWIKWTRIYALLYAVTTIIFYFNSGLYVIFVNIMFPDMIGTLMKFYELGWMCGICDHFSTNGMVLAIGLIICSNEIFANRKKGCLGFNRNKFLYISTFLILYALILSSKRAPLISSFIAIFFTYIVISKRNFSKNLILSCCLCTVLFIVYEFLLPYIPGLSTIADKFQSTSENDGGMLQGREVLWAVAYRMIEASPILGQGFGSYSYVTEKMQMFTTSTHNYYLQVFAELGVLGLLFYILALALALKFTIKQLRKMSLYYNNINNRDMLIMKISLSIQVFVILYNLSASALMYYPILIPYFLSITAVCILTLKYRIK